VLCAVCVGVDATTCGVSVTGFDLAAIRTPDLEPPVEHQEDSRSR
jgi:hypothetical protein